MSDAGGAAAFNVLLDLDGTLTDSEEGIIRCIRYALETMGRPVPAADTLRRAIGPPLRITFAEMFGSDDPALVDEAIARYRERFTTTGIYENRVYDGVTEMLDGIRALGCRMLLATSKPQLHAERIVRHFKLDAWLSGVYGASFDDTHADKTALLGNLLLQEQLDPARCLMAGDRKHDVNGARANRIPVCGVLWGYGGIDELREAQADFLAETPAALLDLVRQRVTR